MGVAVSLSEWPRLTPPLLLCVVNTCSSLLLHTCTYLLHIISSIVTIFMYICVNSIIVIIDNAAASIRCYLFIMKSLCWDFNDILYRQSSHPHLASWLVVSATYYVASKLCPSPLPFMPFCDETAVLVDLMDKSDNASLSLPSLSLSLVTLSWGSYLFSSVNMSWFAVQIASIVCAMLHSVSL